VINEIIHGVLIFLLELGGAFLAFAFICAVMYCIGRLFYP
jgi:hypothetical protein